MNEKAGVGVYITKGNRRLEASIGRQRKVPNFKQ